MSSLQWVIPELHYTSVAKQDLIQRRSYGNEFELHEQEPVGGTHFHTNNFAQKKTCFDTETKGNFKVA